MVRSSLTPITRYLRRLPGLLAALALSAAMSIVLDTVQLRQAQPPMSSLPVIVIMHLFLVGVLAAALGWTAGLVAALTSAMFIDLLFIAPRLSLAVAQAEDMALLVLFLSVSLVNVPLLGRVQSSLRDARARQRELTHLYELITALAGQRRESAIARTLAGHLREALQAQCVEVVIQPDPKRAAVIVCAPEDAAPNRRPDDVVPLMTLRGLLGEIHLWRSATAPPSAWSEQLIRAAAGQAALAIERAALAEAETRAQVLEESDRMKTVLLSSVSHELRTPLATIKAAVSSLRSGAVSWDAAARHELLAVVEEETDQLNHLVGNLLEMSRIEAGALKPQRQWNVLADILHQTLRRLQRASARHHFEIDVSEDLPLVPVDDAQIGQVFANLIGNCLKYAPPDTTIAIRAEVKSDQWLMVSIANQGPQVPAQDLERIFDKFHRVTGA
ncbi:MAG: sensor histidine kinase, partial [Candidatus Roseilinea sp.]|uniref:sensor histidine kinase n=1 Tax=Candidatus Roseilinea sp. TaxID=2838777 RepID=UPI004049E58A